VLRKRAIRSLLVEQVAGLRPPDPPPPDAPPEETAEIAESTTKSSEEERAGGPAPGDVSSVPPSPSSPPADHQDAEAEELSAQLEALHQAERRAKLVIALDWLALVVLFVFRDTATPFLPFDGTIETVFTLGVLAVAVHSGFRLGQLEKYRAVSRVHEEIR